ncbi:MAG: amino acid racemase [Pseudomonadota bacterium]
MRPVGILGGMGPAATITLMQKVLAAQSAHGDAAHVPMLVHQNPQVPSRIAALIDGSGPDPMPVLMTMAQDLERAGAQALAMPSHLAHQYSIAVSHATSLPFLNMVEITAQKLADTGDRKIGVLASPATRAAGVFEKVFEDNGLTAIWPKDEAQTHRVIEIAQSGEASAELTIELSGLTARLIEAGAERLLIANGALSSQANNFPEDLPYTDSMECLAEDIVAFSDQ